jgi:lanosterol synthase
MSYLYGIRFKAPENELILCLRDELYTQHYESIDWPTQRNNIASVDIYTPHTRLANALFAILSVYEDYSIAPLRKAGLHKAYKLIVMEDDNTSFQTIGPVSKMMTLVCRAVGDGIGSEAWKMHKMKRKDFMWIGSEGMRMCGTNGSQLWDIAFISQAMVETGLAEEEKVKEHAMRALKWLDECQIDENPQFYHPAYRQRTKGAWPFSTKEQGYTVSDCTGEGLKATLYLQKHLRCVTFSFKIIYMVIRGLVTRRNLLAIDDYVML